MNAGNDKILIEEIHKEFDSSMHNTNGTKFFYD